MNTLKFELMNK